MKKQIAIITASFLIIAVFAGFADAGAARRHTIEGFLLGTGVTLLGTAIVHNMNRPEPVAIRKGRHHGNRNCRKGHWETQRIWVEPVYETRWNPGHYNRRGRWICGRQERFEIAQGYWQRERVWVRHHPIY
ncbi:MAG: hypothetical protein HUK40_15860 [Desulfobacter sp.]|nr:hypothetical protein [Desulfobacter sp.]WDP87148.1 MAG: hypothetical protein HUN05_20105 [Desulfobacter sp.]